MHQHAVLVSFHDIYAVLIQTIIPLSLLVIAAAAIEKKEDNQIELSIQVFKTEEFSGVVKIARTCLQDAVPITLGQQFSGYHSFIKRQIEEMKKLQKNCLSIVIGPEKTHSSSSFQGLFQNERLRLKGYLLHDAQKYAQQKHLD